jgi:hypothetical protein
MPPKAVQCLDSEYGAGERQLVAETSFKLLILNDGETAEPVQD